MLAPAPFVCLALSHGPLPFSPPGCHRCRLASAPGCSACRQGQYLLLASRRHHHLLNQGTTRLRSPGPWIADSVPLDLPRRSDEYRFELRLADHQAETLTLPGNLRPGTFSITLEPLRRAIPIRLDSAPTGAAIKIQGRDAGRTPVEVSLSFTRPDKHAPWAPLSATWSLDHYAPVTQNVTLEGAEQGYRVELERVVIERSVRVEAKAGNGAPIDAMVTLPDQPAVPTPATLALRFTRLSPSDPWSTFAATVETPGRYLPEVLTLTVDSPEAVSATLAPVTEVLVERLFPGVALEVEPAVHVDRSPVLAALSVRDDNPGYTEPRQVTNFQRGSALNQVVNSFTILPDGEHIIYSVSQVGEQGRVFANLYLKGVREQTSPVTQITRGAQFMDVSPIMSREPEAELVLFQSNRGPQNSWDISALRLRNRNPFGGIRQLTHDQRLNFGPAILKEAGEIYFTSVHPHPAAEPQISFVYEQGTGLTNLGESGLHLHVGPDRIYYTWKAESTGKLQLYSMTPEALGRSTLVSEPDFLDANCYAATLSPNGRSFAFVSDYHLDAKGRRNANLYLADLAQGRPRQLTDNPSDDLAPQWSPTESNVLYFLSNRGGAYNIWRITVTDL